MFISLRFVKYIFCHLFLLMINGSIVQSFNDRSTTENENYCPFIELTSFGSDIHIQCNDSYLVYHEFNTLRPQWKFFNRIGSCNRKGKQKAPVNRCNVTRIGSDYLTVPLKSIKGELACVYCRINYFPISPLIHVVQSDEFANFYTFNLTTSRLSSDQSFEILLAKRVGSEMEHSLVYWFSPKCIGPSIEIVERTKHSIVFTVEDILIGRVEFILRYCDGNCRSYNKCSEDEISHEMSLNRLEIPDSIEKISCDEDCLNGFVPSVSMPTTTLMMNTTTGTMEIISSTNKKQITKHFLLYPLLIVLTVLASIITGIFLIKKIREFQKRRIYTKPNHPTANDVQSGAE